MTPRRDSRRGGAPVGHVADLDAVGAGAVLYLRLWFDGPEAQARVRHDFAGHLGRDHGRAALETLDHLCTLCTRHCRRPLMRRQAGCRCLGGDEACFAQVVGSASEGAREDALMLAMTLVRADMAPGLVALAEEFGLALKRMALASMRPPPCAKGVTLH